MHSITILQQIKCTIHRT